MGLGEEARGEPGGKPSNTFIKFMSLETCSTSYLSCKIDLSHEALIRILGVQDVPCFCAM